MVSECLNLEAWVWYYVEVKKGSIIKGGGVWKPRWFHVLSGKLLQTTFVWIGTQLTNSIIYIIPIYEWIQEWNNTRIIVCLFVYQEAFMV